MINVIFSNPLEEAIKLFEDVYVSYSYIMKVNHDEEEDIDMVIKYFYRKPGYVKMEFIKPFKGATLEYDPEENKAYLRPFPKFKNFVLKLSPKSRLIRSPSGHTVDKSDILTLLYTVKELYENGSMKVSEKENLFIVEVKGKEGFTVFNRINKFILHLDKRTLFPVYASSYDDEDYLIEEVFFEDIKFETR